MAKDATITPAPETPDAQKAPKDFSFIGKLMKLASFPVAGATGFWVMDNAARGEIIAVELQSSDKLKAKFNKYEAERSRLSNAVDKIDPIEGRLLTAAESLTKRMENHNSWRESLYTHLNEKGFNSFGKKLEHLRRVDKQKIIVEGVTIGSIIIGATFAIANSDLFKKPKDDGQSR